MARSKELLARRAAQAKARRARENQKLKDNPK